MRRRETRRVDVENHEQTRALHRRAQPYAVGDGQRPDRAGASEQRADRIDESGNGRGNAAWQILEPRGGIAEQHRRQAERTRS